MRQTGRDAQSIDDESLANVLSDLYRGKSWVDLSQHQQSNFLTKSEHTDLTLWQGVWRATKPIHVVEAV